MIAGGYCVIANCLACIYELQCTFLFSVLYPRISLNLRVCTVRR